MCHRGVFVHADAPAQQDHLVALPHAGNIGHVGHHLIHAHQPGHRRAFAADLHRAGVVEPREAVDIARRNRGDHAVARERIVLVVAQALACGHRVQLRHARLDSHGQLALLGMLVAARIHAVQPRARAHRVHLLIGIAHHADAVQRVRHDGQAAPFERLPGEAQPRELPLIVLIAAQRQMREQPLERSGAAFCQHHGHVLDLLRHQSQPVKASFNLEMHARLLPHALRRRDHALGIRAGEHRQHHALFNRLIKLTIAHQPQHEHVDVQPQRVQLLRFIIGSDGKKALALIVENLSDLLRAQSVRVGLQHGDQPRRGQVLQGVAVVLPEAREINLRPAARARLLRGHHDDSSIQSVY